jgi:hypothetical protein
MNYKFWCICQPFSSTFFHKEHKKRFCQSSDLSFLCYLTIQAHHTICPFHRRTTVSVCDTARRGRHTLIFWTERWRYNRFLRNVQNHPSNSSRWQAERLPLDVLCRIVTWHRISTR